MCPCENNNNNLASLPIDTNTVENQECEFTLYLLQNWLEKLLCVKNNSQQALINISTQELNSLLGTVQSAINVPQNLCLFKSQLNTVRTYIMLIATHVPNC